MLKDYQIVLKKFFLPIVITVNKDHSVNLALDSKLLIKALHKNKYKKPNIELLFDLKIQLITEA